MDFRGGGKKLPGGRKEDEHKAWVGPEGEGRFHPKEGEGRFLASEEVGMGGAGSFGERDGNLYIWRRGSRAERSSKEEKKPYAKIRQPKRPRCSSGEVMNLQGRSQNILLLGALPVYELLDSDRN